MSIKYKSHQKKTSEQVGFYDQTSQSYFRYLAYRDLPCLFKNYLIGKTTLDYGCGTGISTKFLFDQGLDVLGLDISEEMIKKAKSNYPYLKFDSF